MASTSTPSVTEVPAENNKRDIMLDEIVSYYLKKAYSEINDAINEKRELPKSLNIEYTITGEFLDENMLFSIASKIHNSMKNKFSDAEFDIEIRAEYAGGIYLNLYNIFKLKSPIKLYYKRIATATINVEWSTVSST
jgi:hypothetical protein